MTNRWSVRFAGAGVLVLMSAACASMGSQKIDDSRLAGVPSDQMQPVANANAEISRAKEDLASAKQEKVEAENRVKLGKSERDVAKVQFDQAKTQFGLQQKTVQTAQAAPYQASEPQGQGLPIAPAPAPRTLVTPEAFHEARLNEDAAKAKVKYLEKLDGLAGERVKLAEKKVDLGKARLEQARFQVLNESNPAETQAMKLNASQFEAQVQKKQGDVSVADASITQHNAEARAEYQKWAALDHQLSEFPNKPAERAEVPPPPRG